MLLRGLELPARDVNLRHQLMGHSDVLVHFVLSRRRHEAIDMLASFGYVTGLERVFGHRGFEPDVVAPAKPRITFKNICHLMERRRSILAISVARKIDTTID